jgi:hypothetical protein
MKKSEQTCMYVHMCTNININAQLCTNMYLQCVLVMHTAVGLCMADDSISHTSRGRLNHNHCSLHSCAHMLILHLYPRCQTSHSYTPHYTLCTHSLSTHVGRGLLTFVISLVKDKSSCLLCSHMLLPLRTLQLLFHACHVTYVAAPDSRPILPPAMLTYSKASTS